MYQKPIGCKGCPLEHITIGFCDGYGPISPRFIVVAQDPGREEIRADPPRPLIGTTGKIFNRALYDEKIERKDLYLTNVRKCFPAEGVAIDKDTKQRATNFCTKAYLERELEVVKGPILALGGEALDHLIGEHRAITTYRGYPFWSSRYKAWVIGAIHPALIFKIKTATSDSAPAGAIIPSLRSDLRKIKGFTEPVEPEIEYSTSQAQVRHHVAEALKVGKGSLDIESTGYEKDDMDVFTASAQMTLIGLSYEANKALVVSPEYFLELSPLFHDPSFIQIGQNYISDLLTLSNYYQFKPDWSRIHDTMLGFHALYSDIPKRLSVIASFFTNYKYWKHLYKTNMPLYNGYDAASTLVCWEAIAKELTDMQVWPSYIARRNLCDYAMDTYRLGINLDVDRAMRIQYEMIKKRDMVLQILATKFPAMNFNSSKQIIELLYDVLKYPTQYNIKDGKQSRTGDKGAIKTLIRLRPEDQLLKAIQLINEGQNAIEYLDVWRRGRVHYSLRLTSTATGRLEAKDPNVMQQPEEVRVVYIADKECD